MDKKAASDAILILALLKTERKWERERIEAACNAVLDAYRLKDEAAAQKIKH